MLLLIKLNRKYMYLIKKNIFNSGKFWKEMVLKNKNSAFQIPPPENL
jgi:hypothetical protein